MTTVQTVTPAGLLADAVDGAAIDRVLLVREAERSTKRDGAPFLRMTLGDRSGVVSALAWDADGDEPVVCGEPVHVVGRLVDHPRYGRQITVSTLRRPACGDVSWTELLDGPGRTAADLEQAMGIGVVVVLGCRDRTKAPPRVRSRAQEQRRSS